MPGGYLDPGINAFMDFLFRDMLSEASQERQFGYQRQLHEADQKARMEQARQELIQKALQEQAAQAQFGQSLQSAFDLGYPEVTRPVPGTGVPTADILRERGRPFVGPEELPGFPNLPGGGPLFEAINAAHPPGALTGDAEERDVLPIRPAETVTRREPSGLSPGQILAELSPQQKATLLKHGATGGLEQVLGTLDSPTRLLVLRTAYAKAQQAEADAVVALRTAPDQISQAEAKTQVDQAKAIQEALKAEAQQLVFAGEETTQAQRQIAGVEGVTPATEKFDVNRLRAIATDPTKTSEERARAQAILDQRVKEESQIMGAREPFQERAREQADLRERGRDADKMLLELGSAGSILTQFTELVPKVNEPGLQGRIKGMTQRQAQAFLQTEPNVVTLERIGKAYVSLLSRSVARERGVLTEGDIDRARSNVPLITDNLETANNKVKTLQRMLEENQERVNRYRRGEPIQIVTSSSPGPVGPWHK